MNDTVLEQHAFGAEVGRLLDLVVHSLYSEREIFLRELVANAADAVDRRRFESLTDSNLAPPAEAKIRIVPDKQASTLLIADDGIGMTRQEMIDNLGTIARSGTRAFAQSLADSKPEDRPSLIGQFGVGFYSAFMVADRVEVTSRKAGSEEAFTWASDGAGEFTLAHATRESPGTDVVLHIKSDATEYLEPMRLETVIRKWADHITLPITVAQDGKDQPANEGTALWRKSKSDVTEQSYKEFYRHLGHFFDDPWATLHWRAEGTLEYFCLLFIPGMKPFDVLDNDRDSHVRLHVRRMFITDKADLLPHWLRFVSGVVDTEDLPLNVSREMLQTTPVLARIRKALIGRVLSELKNRAGDAADYDKFWENFGAILKEGIWEDSEHRAEIAPLLRFRSSSQDGWTSLPDYVSRMQPGQEAIYYLTGDSPEALKTSPQLEGFRAKGIEVLLMSDSIDSFWPERLDSFEDKKLRSVTQAAEDLGKGEDLPDISPLLAALKTALGDSVADVRATARLTDSAVVLASGAHGPDLTMQRLLRRAGRATMPAKPVLEVNPRHKLIETLSAKLADTGLITEAAATLLDLAQVQEGDLPADATAFARRVTTLLAGSLG
ncbi:molecular chaperone HtpG [Rhodopila globiformis]|uniref:Chaperone protein HtpG n=1 Tax=Rhodopila globiformis TaxID=1071 RepID=A0A2S6N0N6_RHOGL|nr:molecular chaperone HtpG [Rhodopila globiformis]PPQ28158.1 molecular chaperone HtpG [Rhodopila globiformis]